jgi:membrane-bound lytic murein transglycosylase B
VTSVAHRRRRASLSLLLGLFLPFVSLTPATGLPRSQPPATPDSAAEANALAAESARKVTELTARYEQVTAELSASAAELARAFADQSAAEKASSLAQDRLRRARTDQTAQIRALYADGGQLGLTMTVLTSDTPEQALWWVEFSRQVENNISSTAARNAALAAAASDQARLAAQDSSARSQELAASLARLKNRATEAESLLVQAQVELKTLREQAGELAAQEEAQRLAAAQEAARRANLTSTTVGALSIPADYLATYRSASATCSGVDWTLLAAVGQVESGHGANNGPSSAGAVGPMQFMPSTFTAYAVDGNRDGQLDPWNHQDAIFSAARYLCASGASRGTPEGIHAALLAYNHAEWYVQLVLGAQSAIAAAHSS